MEVPVEIPSSDVVDKVIKKIEAIIDEKEVQNRKLTIVLVMLKKIKDEQFSIEQAEKIISIVTDRDRLPCLNVGRNSEILYSIKQYQKFAVQKLCDAIRIKMELTNNVEELRQLNSKLPYSIEKLSPTVVSPTKMKISAKISKLKNEKVFDDMENNFSDNIVEIVKSIVSNRIDDVTIKELVNSEVEKTMTNKSGCGNIGFKSEEQYKKQIFYRVAKLLERRGEEYPISNPEKVIDVLEQLFGMGFDANIRIVINNYIARKEFDIATKICNKYREGIDPQSALARIIDSLKKEIKKAEIGQIILKGICANATEDEKNAFFDVIEKRMQEVKFSYSTIPLGYSKNGKKKITLADIWEDERDRKR